MRKKILFRDEARAALIRGVDVLADAVTTTLGPRGRNVALGRKWNAPRVVHDGVSVAKEIELDDPAEQMGVDIAREAAEKTNDMAGDGTTTSILLTHALVHAGNDKIAKGESPMGIQRGLNKAVALVVDELVKTSRPVKDTKTLAHIATISAADEKIGDMVSAAFDKVGKLGAVIVEEGRDYETKVDYKDGMEFDRGFAEKAFLTDQARLEALVENPYIFLTGERIATNKQIFPILEAIEKVEGDARFSVVIIADRVDYEALQSLGLNHERSRLCALTIEAPGFGDEREAILEDIAALTGGKVFDPRKGMAYENIDISMFGRSERVWSGKDTSRIIAGKGDENLVAIRVRQIENLIAAEESEYKKEKLQERLARIGGSVAIIKVGAPTQAELPDRMERMKDAVEATKSAIVEGYLPGGGTALLKLRSVLGNKKFPADEVEGVNLLMSSLRKPIERLFDISGEDLKYIDEIEKHEDIDYGYNVATREFGSLYKMGVIDPTRVVRAALQNAASVAGTILTTEALVAVVDKETSESSKS